MKSRLFVQKNFSSNSSNNNTDIQIYDDFGNQIDNKEAKNVSMTLNHELEHVGLEYCYNEGDQDIVMNSENEFEHDSSSVSDETESNNNTNDFLSEKNIDQFDFDLNNISTDYENVYPIQFLSQLMNFIRDACLNKTTTEALLALLRSTCSFGIDNIPKTTNSLWQQVGVAFTYKRFYYCSICFMELIHYQDCCSHCKIKSKPNSELFIFSIDDELKRIVQTNIDVIRWYSVPDHQINADIVNGEWYKRSNTGEPRLSLMLSTDGKPLIKSKQSKTSVWPVISFLVEIPPPLREYFNNIVLLGLWHSPVTPPCSLLLDKIVNNIKLLMATGINIYLNNKMIHFSINVQLITGDFPARSKCNRLVNHNGFYACSRCLFEGTRCSSPCGNHTLYRWTDFILTPQAQRTQEHMNLCAQQINSVNKIVFGVAGTSPLASILSIPQQSTFDYFHLVLEIHFRLFASESCLQIFDKIAHGSVILGEQISFWWCVFRQIRSKETHYSHHLLIDEKLIEDNFFDFNNLEKYRQEFDLIYNQTFGEFPNLSLKYYSRYQCGLIVYHSVSYSRRQNSNSYTVCVKDEKVEFETEHD
ncbi:unnamed protein product [Rotaria sordida]|uniref:Transposase n=1 Tax=Rotaria sordida TaxID=392033 RepID=A0A819KQG1_9BILA|nr:unnamed protein product [Rotaria sordida]